MLGIHVTIGSIQLRSHVDLHPERGAGLPASGHRPPYCRHALDAEACPRLQIEGFTGLSADPKWSAQLIR